MYAGTGAFWPSCCPLEAAFALADGERSRLQSRRRCGNSPMRSPATCCVWAQGASVNALARSAIYASGPTPEMPVGPRSTCSSPFDKEVGNGISVFIHTALGAVDDIVAISVVGCLVGSRSRLSSRR
eukprot:COSAG06_NODE_4561_length_4144_cov_1.728554_1_plen_126_part_10